LPAVELAVNTHVRHSTIFSCELEKIVGESVSSVVGNQRYWVFGDWIRSAIAALLAATFFHLSGILILPYTGCWSFLFTGAVMVFSLLVLAELQWDMRHPIN